METGPGESLDRYETVVTLRDGSTLRLRPIRPDDCDRWLAFFQRLSRHTIYLRFHHLMRGASTEDARHFCAVDYDSTFALVATAGEGAEERIVAVGRYARLDRSDTAELALAVEDAYQGKGIGTHLLKQLAAIASQKGLRAFEAEVLAENHEVMEVLEDSGFGIRQELEYGVYRVEIDISSTE